MTPGARRTTGARIGVAAVAVGVAVVLVLVGPRLADFPPSLGEVPDWFASQPELALANMLGLVAWVCLLWLCAGVMLGALAAIPGAVGRAAASLARRMLPGTLRRLVEVGLGVTLVTAGIAPVIGASPAAAAVSAAGSPVAAAASTAVGTPAGQPGWPDLTRPESPAPAPSGAPGAGVTGGQAEWPDLTRPASTDAAGPSSSSGAEPQPGQPAEMDLVALTAAIGQDAAPPAGPAPSSPAGSASSVSSPADADPRSRPAADAPAPGTPPAPASAVSAVSEAAEWPDLSRPHSSGPSPGATAPPSQDPIIPRAPLGTGTPSAAPGGLAGGAAGGTVNPDAATGEIVVKRGDTLWSIVAHYLGPDATEEQIAAEWPRWWAANADVIGPDPDLILPGQRLLPPPGPDPAHPS